MGSEKLPDSFGWIEFWTVGRKRHERQVGGRVISYTKSAVTDSVNQKSAFEESSGFRLTQGVAA
jgi:hypothetical protein